MKEIFPVWCPSGLKPFVSAAELGSAVSYLADQVDSFLYEAPKPVVLGVLKGSFVFLADLVRELTTHPAADFIWPQRYKGTSGGEVKALAFPEYCLKGAHVVVVDDILDEGNTLRWILEWVRSQEPAAVAACVLFNKSCIGLAESLPVDRFFSAIHVQPEHFIVGYGMDYNERGRSLPEVYSLCR